MMIRQATAQEMLSLWNCTEDQIFPTARFFAENIDSQNAEFWTVDNDGELIGELYVFKNLDDKDFADGTSKAYLCAFRIRKEYRGQGLGSQLMKTVFDHLQTCGFSSVTIGVDETEDANIRLYKRLGFNSKVKDCYFDPCDMDSEMKPRACPCFWLLGKTLA